MTRAKYFLVAAFLSVAALWKAGAPMFPVLAGVAVAAVWTLRSTGSQAKL